MKRRDYDLRADDFTGLVPVLNGCRRLKHVLLPVQRVVQLHEARVLHHAGRQGGEIRQQPGRNGAPGQTMEGKGCRCLYQSLK